MGTGDGGSGFPRDPVSKGVTEEANYCPHRGGVTHEVLPSPPRTVSAH